MFYEKPKLFDKSLGYLRKSVGYHKPQNNCLDIRNKIYSLTFCKGILKFNELLHIGFLIYIFDIIIQIRPLNQKITSNLTTFYS